MYHIYLHNWCKTHEMLIIYQIANLKFFLEKVSCYTVSLAYTHVHIAYKLILQVPRILQNDASLLEYELLFKHEIQMILTCNIYSVQSHVHTYILLQSSPLSHPLVGMKSCTCSYMQLSHWPSRAGLLKNCHCYASTH